MSLEYFSLKEDEEWVLRTIHGSHLYGTNTPNSDVDYYWVFTSPDYNRRKICRQAVSPDGVDVTALSLDRFMYFCSIGVPQALEALYSHKADINPKYSHLLKSIKPGYYQTLDRYERTIFNFAFNTGGRSARQADKMSPQQKAKLKRHSLRLAYNYRQFSEMGTFNPTLPQSTVNYFRRVSALKKSQYAFEEVLLSLMDPYHSPSVM